MNSEWQSPKSERPKSDPSSAAVQESRFSFPGGTLANASLLFARLRRVEARPKPETRRGKHGLTGLGTIEQNRISGFGFPSGLGFRISVFALALLCTLAATATAQVRKPDTQPVAAQQTNRFDREILAFLKSDATNPPPKHAILFLGSSSIRMWKNVAKDLPEYPVINRGFGGSEISDSIHFAGRIVFPYEPSIIVFYAGGNDIHNKKSPETVFADFQTLVKMVHEKLPETRIAYISIAPNPSRWAEIDRVRAANKLIENFTKSDPLLSYIDAHSKMLGEDGQPKPDIYLADRLHMNAKGYAIWKELVGEHLRKLGAKRR